MADKQVTRPLALDPSWANDLNLNDPGETWDGTPTKVDPGAGKRDDGYLPDEDIPAQHVNFQFNELGRWVQYLSNAQAMNWFPGGRVGDAVSTQINSCHGLCFDEGGGFWVGVGHVVSIAGEHCISQDGSTWTDVPDAAFASMNLDFVASKPSNYPPTQLTFAYIISSLSNAAVVEVHSGVGITGYAVTGTGVLTVRMQAWDEGNQRWIIVGGEDQGGTPLPAVWTDTSPMAGPTQRASAAVNSTRAELVAINRSGLVVVMGNNSPFDVWTSSDAVTFTQATPTGIGAGQNARSMIWDDARGLFVLLTETTTYTSTDGVNWTQVGTFTGANHQIRCFASDGGGLYLAGATGGPVIRYSSDGGVTWRIVLVPHDYDQTGGNGACQDPVTAIAYSRAFRKFGYAIANDSGTYYGFVGTSLALGDAETEANGLTKSVPQVT